MKTVLCYGDSNTYGYDPETGGRYGTEERWPCILQKLLGPGYTVIAEGCNGRTTVFDDPTDPWANGLDFLRPCLRSHKPLDTVILMLGSNDLKAYLHLSAKEIAGGAGHLVRVIQEFTKTEQGYVPEILLVSPALVAESVSSSPFYPDFDESAVVRSREFAGEYVRVAAETGCRFLDAAPITEVSSLDAVHFTRAAHRSLAEALLPFFR